MKKATPVVFFLAALALVGCGQKPGEEYEGCWQESMGEICITPPQKNENFFMVLETPYGRGTHPVTQFFPATLENGMLKVGVSTITHSSQNQTITVSHENPDSQGDLRSATYRRKK